MKTIYKKIASVKESIKKTKLEKKGHNEFSNYDYFTPDQIESLVYDSCNSNGLLTKFDLKRNEFGEFGILSVIDIESGETESFEMATAIPVIKATNIAQQLGGCVTYTERYLKMTAFGIVENNLDPDSKDNSEPKETQPKQETIPNTENKPSESKQIEITDDIIEKWNGKIYNGKVYIDNIKYTITESQEQFLIGTEKYQPDNKK